MKGSLFMYETTKGDFVKKICVVVLTCVALVGCAPPIPSGEMVPMTGIYEQIPVNENLQNNVSLGSVVVSEKATGPAHANVKPEMFKDAIQQALLTSNMSVRAGSPVKYVLDATLLELDYPFIGFDLTTTSKARYVLKRGDTGEALMDETITQTYTAEFGEAFNGDQRMRISIAKAVRENITHMIRVLANQTNLK